MLRRRTLPFYTAFHPRPLRQAGEDFLKALKLGFQVPLWLGSGVNPPEVARRAGHSVEVLLRVDAKCIDGQEDTMNQRISNTLEGSY